MSGPEEVERVIGIVSEGVRRKMMRPKCLARESWIGDSTLSLLNRVHDERRELAAIEGHARRWVMRYGDVEELNAVAGPTGAFSKGWTFNGVSDLVRSVADECYDLAAFGAMLEDPLRLERLGIRRLA